MMIDLKQFCSDETRPRIAEPWSDGNYSYATDGHILIRVPRRKDVRDAKDVPDGAIEIERFENIFKQEPKKWFPIGKIKLEKIECNKCEGTGLAYTCPECGGKGYTSASNKFSDYDDLKCMTCDGSGTISKEQAERLIKNNVLPENYFECEKCAGRGWVYKDEITKFGVAKFSNVLLSRISALPNCKIGIFGELEPARFIFDGGDGIIMPTR